MFSTKLGDLEELCNLTTAEGATRISRRACIFAFRSSRGYELVWFQLSAHSFGDALGPEPKLWRTRV